MRADGGGHVAAGLDREAAFFCEGEERFSGFFGYEGQVDVFFTRTTNGKREGKAFLARLQERTIDRDTPASVSSYFAQLKACRRWGKEEPDDLSLIRQPVLLANGDHDRMLPTPNTLDMARRLPNNELVIYPDAGHGGIFQFHEQFVEKALEFLAK